VRLLEQKGGGSSSVKALWIAVGIVITVVVMFLLLFFTLSKYP
jgi:hypothetical protein